DGTVKASCRAALKHLELSTESIETLGVLESDKQGAGYTVPSEDRQQIRNERRRYIREQIQSADRVLDALERLDLALSRDLHTDRSGPGLDSMVDELSHLAERASAYSNP
ncbi:MAG: hypothetical protein K0U93_04545, partial [Gammaproteobacteria bacterium]|nr:hypothetical protein [Gammaproteobacteria bacterium]